MALGKTGESSRRAGKGDIFLRKKVWAASPVFYAAAAVMLIMACISWRWSSFVFYLELFLTALTVAGVLFASSLFRAHVATAVKSAQKVLSGPEYERLRDFAMPVAVVGESGDIVWINEAFQAGPARGQSCLGDNIIRFLYPNSLPRILDGKGTDVVLEELKYTVYGTKTEYGAILYFVDDTYYKDIKQRFDEDHPVTAIIRFDNREELMRDANGGEDARVASDVETALRTWSQSMNGFLKRLSGGQFLMMTDEKHIRQASEKRFEILDTIREIKSADQKSATISIGVGRGAPNLVESERWARQALDMALGRGGDQVAIKQNESYEFFGGLSKGVEKRDKVRTRVIAATLSDHIKASDTVFIMGHRFSDMDCVGSACGIWGAVTRGLKKDAYIVINRQQSMASILVDTMDNANPETRVFISPAEAMSMITENSMLVVVDTHSPDFVESKDLLEKAGRVVVIDHHRMMVKHISNAVVFYHEPYASSASEMVAELVQYISENSLSRIEAEALLAGIMLDTKNFVLKTGVRTFEASAYLRRRGADTVEVKRFFANSIGTYKAKYSLVSAAEVYNGCAIACAEEEIPDIRIASAQAADELLSIEGVNASFVMFPTGTTVNISARSLGDVNVQIIMEALGGGGHLTMAGAQLQNMTVRQARETLVSVLNNTLSAASKQPVAGNKDGK